MRDLDHVERLKPSIGVRAAFRDIMERALEETKIATGQPVCTYVANDEYPHVMRGLFSAVWNMVRREWGI